MRVLLLGGTGMLGHRLWIDLRHAPPRMGDVRDSLADIRAAHAAFGFDPRTSMADGLAEYWAWFSRDPLTLRRLGIAR
jgi:UDP-glucose 4-epimerase